MLRDAISASSYADPVARFRIVLVHPAGYIHASALAEAVTYLTAMLRTLGHVADAVEGDPVEEGLLATPSGAHLIVACAHLLDAALAARLPPRTIILNSEPLAAPMQSGAAGSKLVGDAYLALLGRCHVWDYSPVHLAHLPHTRASVIPFWFCPSLVRTALPRTAGTHVLFYGVITPHRHPVLRHLVAHGVPLDLRFGWYGEPRDRLVRSALAVLNLHKTEDARVFESIRCFHPLINGVPVISEDTADPAAEPFRAAVSFVPAAGLVRTIVTLLADRAAFQARAQAQVSHFATLDPRPAIAEAVARYLSCTSTTTRP